jgi:alpha-N-arabinofuranosidase
MLHNLGRETFLLPLNWKDGWPTTNGVELEMDAPLPASPLQKKDAGNFTADFSTGTLQPEWTYIRNPDTKKFEVKQGKLYIAGNGKSLSFPKSSPSFIGIRQRSFFIDARVLISGIENGSRAGITAFYNEDYHYALFIEKKDKKCRIAVRKRIHDLEAETFEKIIPQNFTRAELQIVSDRKQYGFSFSIDNEDRQDCGSGLVAGLCTECTHTMSFTGVFIGLFVETGSGCFESFHVTDTISAYEDKL